jgi:methionyl-tRNA synthetase
VIGKGILRFHAVYWPAILLSAGEPLPTSVLVHDYLTVDGRKIAKSGSSTAEPSALVDRFGTDALRWWLVRDVPRSGDADFREDLLVRRANELADDLGNLVSRTVALVARSRPAGAVAGLGAASEVDRLRDSLAAVAPAVEAALARFDVRSAADAIWSAVAEANRFVAETAPWELARSERGGDAQASPRLDAVLAALLDACRTIARELAPFLPNAAGRIDHALDRCDPALARALFPKFDVA